MPPPTGCSVPLKIDYELQKSKNQEQEEERELGRYHGGRAKASLALCYQGSHSINCLTSSLHSCSN